VVLNASEVTLLQSYPYNVTERRWKQGKIQDILLKTPVSESYGSEYNLNMIS
jgi:hypothetical protein